MNPGDRQHPTGPVNEIRAGAESAKGLREENQDAMTRFLSRYGEVILVADGMGGHQGGATASDMVAKRYRLHLESMPPDMPLSDALQHATVRVNDEIHERGHSGDPAVAGMGSTLVLAVLTQSPHGWEVTVANAGDSRAYLVRDGVLRQLTKDHTAVQRMIDAGLLTEANARNHPNASVLTRALGQQQGTTVEVYPPVPLQAGDGLLLCSDGLSGYVVDGEIARVIAGAVEPNNIVRGLVETALKLGSDDNITVQFLRIGEKAAVPAGMPVPPPVAVAARPHRKGRMVALALVIVAAALAWPVGQMIGKWWGNGDGGKDKDTSKASSSTKADKKSKPTETHHTGDKDKTTSPPPSDVPKNTDQPGPTIPPQGVPESPKKPTIIIHSPDPTNKPGWIDELKKKLPGGFDLKLSIAQMTLFRPQKGSIKVVFKPEFESQVDTIKKQINEVKDLKEFTVQLDKRKDLLSDADILIVGSAEIYKQPAKPAPH